MINALLLLPVCCVGEDTLPGEQALHKMLGELGMTAPEPPVMPGLHNTPVEPDWYLGGERSNQRLRLHLNDDLAPRPEWAQEKLDEPRDEHSFYAHIDENALPHAEMEMEVAMDASNKRPSEQNGIFWMVGGGERLVYLWDGERVVRVNPTELQSGQGMAYDPDMDNLFVVSDADEQLFVFTVERKERKGGSQ